MFRIKTFNNIAIKGLEEFDRDLFEVGPDVENPDGIICRSYNLNDYVIPDSVKVIGRAGAGVNNIPTESLTPRGVVVMNTPGANANAVKELVLTGMLLACRNICSAWEYGKQLEGDDETISKLVEQNKKRFAGFELPNKTLCVIGLGHIGVRVANAARHLGMRVIGYDPKMTVQNAWELRSSVIQAESIEEALAEADFVTVHVPFNEHTKNLINQKTLSCMKDGVVLLNFARGGIVDREALNTALEKGKVRNYVSDFPCNLFMNNPRVIALPHLGASTREAEENCAVMVAQQVSTFLQKGHIQHSVNFPTTRMSYKSGSRIAIVNSNVPNMVAQISTAVSSENINIIDMINKSRENIAYTLLDISKEPSAELLKKLKQIDGVISVRAV